MIVYIQWNINVANKLFWLNLSGRKWWNTEWNQEMSRGAERDSSPHRWAIETADQAGRGGAWEVWSSQETQTDWTGGKTVI